MATATGTGHYDKSKTLLTSFARSIGLCCGYLSRVGWWFVRKPHFNGTRPVSISVLLYEPRPVKRDRRRRSNC
jgi:hypothetical protein